MRPDPEHQGHQKNKEAVKNSAKGFIVVHPGVNNGLRISDLPKLKVRDVKV
jgi:hypothetical protein